MSNVPEYTLKRNGIEPSSPSCHNSWMNHTCPMCGDHLGDTHGEMMHHIIFHLTGHGASEPGVIYGWILLCERLVHGMFPYDACPFCRQAVSALEPCCGAGRNMGYWYASHLAKSEQCALAFLLSDSARMEI